MVIASGPLEAIACVRGDGGLRGTVKFFPVHCATLVVAELEGLPQEGFFALHIHEGDSCGGPGHSGSGGHYDPRGREHPHHAGDLPPLLSRNGRAFLAVETDRFNAWEAVGKTVVVHSGPEDFHTQPSGNAGAKIGCGVIRGC